MARVRLPHDGLEDVMQDAMLTRWMRYASWRLLAFKWLTDERP